MAKPCSAVMIGAGNRGYEVYGAYALAHPDELRFVAVAEPHPLRRARFARAHDIPAERQFHTWEDLPAAGRIADAAFICTLDRLHIGPAVAALEVGYDVLLEKPMATTLTDCVQVVQAAERTGRLLQICHVLRYTALFSSLHEIVTSGRLGDVVTVEHRENVAYWHMAHSFVRGNWRSSGVESPMILAKCCHDLDILTWNLGACARLSSVGGLEHFRAENAPPGTPARCTDGCPAAATCPWYAPRLYLEREPLYQVARRLGSGAERLGAALALDHPTLTRVARRFLPALDRALDYREWPISTISEETSQAALRHALETGPYGRCVYHCDNDVVDHQIVSMEMENGVSVVLAMHGHSHEEGRTIRYDGTRATLRAKFAYGTGSEIEIHDHRSGSVERVVLRRAIGHGGGDAGLMAAFVHALRDRSAVLTTARTSLESHLLAFAAEQARREGRFVKMDDFRAMAEQAGPG